MALELIDIIDHPDISQLVLDQLSKTELKKLLDGLACNTMGLFAIAKHIINYRFDFDGDEDNFCNIKQLLLETFPDALDLTVYFQEYLKYNNASSDFSTKLVKLTSDFSTKLVKLTSIKAGFSQKEITNRLTKALINAEVATEWLGNTTNESDATASDRMTMLTLIAEGLEARALLGPLVFQCLYDLLQATDTDTHKQSIMATITECAKSRVTLKPQTIQWLESQLKHSDTAVRKQAVTTIAVGIKTRALPSTQVFQSLISLLEDSDTDIHKQAITVISECIKAQAAIEPEEIQAFMRMLVNLKCDVFILAPTIIAACVKAEAAVVPEAIKGFMRLLNTLEQHRVKVELDTTLSAQEKHIAISSKFETLENSVCEGLIDCAKAQLTFASQAIKEFIPFVNSPYFVAAIYLCISEQTSLALQTSEKLMPLLLLSAPDINNRMMIDLILGVESIKAQTAVVTEIPQGLIEALNFDDDETRIEALKLMNSYIKQVAPSPQLIEKCMPLLTVPDNAIRIAAIAVIVNGCIKAKTTIATRVTQQLMSFFNDPDCYEYEKTFDLIITCIKAQVMLAAELTPTLMQLLTKSNLLNYSLALHLISSCLKQQVAIEPEVIQRTVALCIDSSRDSEILQLEDKQNRIITEIAASKLQFTITPELIEQDIVSLEGNNDDTSHQAGCRAIIVYIKLDKTIASQVIERLMTLFISDASDTSQPRSKAILVKAIITCVEMDNTLAPHIIEQLKGELTNPKAHTSQSLLVIAACIKVHSQASPDLIEAFISRFTDIPTPHRPEAIAVIREFVKSQQVIKPEIILGLIKILNDSDKNLRCEAAAVIAICAKKQPSLIPHIIENVMTSSKDEATLNKEEISVITACLAAESNKTTQTLICNRLLEDLQSSMEWPGPTYTSPTYKWPGDKLWLCLVVKHSVPQDPTFLLEMAAEINEDCSREGKFVNILRGWVRYQQLTQTASGDFVSPEPQNRLNSLRLQIQYGLFFYTAKNLIALLPLNQIEVEKAREDVKISDELTKPEKHYLSLLISYGKSIVDGISIVVKQLPSEQQRDTPLLCIFAAIEMSATGNQYEQWIKFFEALKNAGYEILEGLQQFILKNLQELSERERSGTTQLNKLQKKYYALQQKFYKPRGLTLFGSDLPVGTALPRYDYIQFLKFVINELSSVKTENTRTALMQEIKSYSKR